jgi:hypothetical protein
MRDGGLARCKGNSSASITFVAKKMALASQHSHGQTEQRQDQQHSLEISATCVWREAEQPLNEIHNRPTPSWQQMEYATSKTPHTLP